MSDLVEWLLEQIAEDERVAQAALLDETAPWRDQDWAEIDAPSLAHVQRHDPHRVLAECEAKRGIIELHARAHECSTWDHVDEIDNHSWVPGGEDCSTVRLLGLPYADRPGFREEWRP